MSGTEIFSSSVQVHAFRVHFRVRLQFEPVQRVSGQKINFNMDEFLILLFMFSAYTAGMETNIYKILC